MATPDVRGPAFPPVALGFADLAPAPSGVPAAVISSSDDPYCSPPVTTRLADHWSAQHVDLGLYGRPNEAAGLGQWDLGWNLIQEFADKTAA